MDYGDEEDIASRRADPREGFVPYADALRRVSRPLEDTVRGMLGRIAGLVRYRLERFLVGGAHYRLAFIAVVIVLTSAVGGALVAELEDVPADDAVWWAFLRLTDPGYLGDDEGVLRRSVSTVLTVAGYVIFMGALVAILTTSLHKAIDRLESGLTPIAQSGHVLVVGWNSRTVTILRELFESEGRARRFLARHWRRRLTVVLLADEVTSRLRHELRDRLGPSWRASQTILRSGTALRVPHLARVDFAHAAAIILPANAREAGGAANADAATIKAVLSMSTYAEAITGDPPPLVCEVLDGRKARIARRAYHGPIDVVATDELVASLFAQIIRHPGLSGVYADLLTHVTGSTIYLREAPSLADRGFVDLVAAFSGAILLGVVRPVAQGFDAILAPDTTFVSTRDDRYVLIARRYEDTVPGDRSPPAAAATSPIAVPRTPDGPPRRLLILGFNHKVPALLRELGRHDAARFEVLLVSKDPKEDRRKWMRGQPEPDGLELAWVRGDRTVPDDLLAHDPASFDSILLTSGDGFATAAEADAETIATYLLLRDLIDDEAPRHPHVLVELMDAPNRALFIGQDAEVVVTPLVVGRVLAQVTLRRELKPVYDELLGPRGAEFDFRSPGVYGIDRNGPPLTFAELRDRVGRHGDVLAGIHDPHGPKGGASAVHPEPTSRWSFARGEALVVVTEKR